MGKTEDPLTRLPIVKADFHEFCYIDGKLAARYLGDLKTLQSNSLNVLHCATSNPMRNAFSSAVSLPLALVHACKKDFGRAHKYMRDVTEADAEKSHIGILQIADLALQGRQNDLAIEALNKISFHAPDPTFLLYKIHTEDDQEQLSTLSNRMVQASVGAVGARVYVANQYLIEAIKLGIDSRQGADFFMIAGGYFQTIAKKNHDSFAMFSLFNALSFIIEEKRLLFASQQELRDYANCCIDVINKGDSNHPILRTKELYPLDYEAVIPLLKKYGTKKLIEE